MNTRLDPPPVPPLTTTERARLRDEVMDKSRPAGHRPARRWIAPAVGVAAVAAVVTGTLVLVPTPDHGASTQAGHSTTPTVVITPTRVLPSPVKAASIDLGALSAAEARVISGRCAFPDPGPDRPAVLWARRIRWISPDNPLPVVVMIVKGDPQRGGFNKGVAVCQTESFLPMRVRDAQWAKRPTATQGLLKVGGAGVVQDGYRENWMIYRARPEIKKVESRYVWTDGSGPWIQGVVADGFAYTDSRAQFGGQVPAGVKEEFRAFDAKGRVVPLHL